MARNKSDALIGQNLPFPNDYFDYALGSFLYFLLPDFVKGLKGKPSPYQTSKPG
jgi:hypothetical protein